MSFLSIINLFPGMIGVTERKQNIIFFFWWKCYPLVPQFLLYSGNLYRGSHIRFISAEWLKFEKYYWKISLKKNSMQIKTIKCPKQSHNVETKSTMKGLLELDSVLFKGGIWVKNQKIKTIKYCKWSRMSFNLLGSSLTF